MRSDLSRAFLAAAAATAIAFTAADASAFCRTTTTPGAGGCVAGGSPLYHASGCIPYRLLAQESRVLSNAVLSDAIAKAFATWSAPNGTCSPGIAGIELPPTGATTIVEYKTGERQNNVFGVLRGPWTHGGDAVDSTLALATLTFNAVTGEVYDADMEINENVAWSSVEGPAMYDIHSVMTHEVGHVLGLAHSDDREAAMAPTYVPGSTTQRLLAEDDKKGVCAVYPDAQTRRTAAGLTASTACDPSPAGNGASEPASPPPPPACTITATTPSSAAGPWLAALGLVAIGWQARRRQARV